MKNVFLKSNTEQIVIWIKNDETGKYEPKFVYFPDTGERIPYMDVYVVLV